MKGVIAACLAELVIEKFGKDKWEAILEKSGLKKSTSFLPFQDIDDAAVMTVVESTCKILKITLNQAADAFGDYWVNDYAPKVYKTYYRKAKNAREFLLKMDDVHDQVTKSIKNAQPPRFEYEEKDERTLVLHYKSQRNMIIFLMGLVKGVGRYFDEKLIVRKLSDKKLEVLFR